MCKIHAFHVLKPHTVYLSFLAFHKSHPYPIHYVLRDAKAGLYLLLLPGADLIASAWPPCGPNTFASCLRPEVRSLYFDTSMLIKTSTHLSSGKKGYFNGPLPLMKAPKTTSSHSLGHGISHLFSLIQQLGPSSSSSHLCRP